MLQFIARETAARGLDFQLGIWTHAYAMDRQPQFRPSHRRPDADRPMRAYCRDALAILLKECPEITGVTLRIHGESGVPEGSYDFWQTLFEAIPERRPHRSRSTCMPRASTRS